MNIYHISHLLTTCNYCMNDRIIGKTNLEIHILLSIKILPWRMSFFVNIYCTHALKVSWRFIVGFRPFIISDQKIRAKFWLFLELQEILAPKISSTYSTETLCIAHVVFNSFFTKTRKNDSTGWNLQSSSVSESLDDYVLTSPMLNLMPVEYGIHI